MWVNYAYDAGTDNAEATFINPKVTYMKALLTCDPVFLGRELVHSHISARPTIDFRTDYVKNWSIGP